MGKPKDDWREYSRALSEQAQNELNGGQTDCPAYTREQLEKRHGEVWDSYTLARDFDVEAFCGRKVVVVRRSDGRRGTVLYQHYPRFYFKFEGWGG